MPVSETLKSFREKGYGEKKEEGTKPEESGGPRLIKLTDDEVKSLGQYQGGEEAKCLVSGRLEGNTLTVMSVAPAEGGGGMDEMMEAMRGPQGGPPLMQNQTMPSPS